MSTTTAFTSVIPPAPGRHLHLDGTYNLRDVGGYATRDGYRTRWRTIFRAAKKFRETAPWSGSDDHHATAGAQHA